MSDDRRRGLLTDTERAVLLGNKEVSDNYYYTIVSRVRTKLEELDEDLEALEEHGALLDELQEIVCKDN
jgi:hypothetical protein